MATKTMQTRLQMKRDLYANWVEKNPQLLEGELAVVIIPAEAGAVVQEPAVMLKVGAKNEAGELYNFNDLPWLSAVSADVYDWAKAENKPEYNTSEIVGLKDREYRFVKDDEAGYQYHLEYKGVGDADWVRVENSVINVPAYDDTYVVKTVGNQEIAGVKTFSGGEIRISDQEYYVAISAPQLQANQEVRLPEKGGVLATTTDVSELRQYVGNIPSGYTQETIVAYIDKKAEETLSAASGGSTESAASVLAALNTHKTEAEAEFAAIKNGESINSFKDVEDDITELGETLMKSFFGPEDWDIGSFEDLNTEAKYVTGAINEIHAEVDAINNEETGILAQAKQYADENGAKYGIEYDSVNKKIKLVEDGSTMEIDASDFIKDGMIETVTIGDDNDLVITFNTAAGKEDIRLPLDQLVDIYTGVEGARVKVTVASDKSISAELVAGSISKNYLDEGVQASLDKADTALQTHQDISHLVTRDELNSGLAVDVSKLEAADIDLNNRLEAVESILETSETDYIVFDCGTASKVI